MQRDARCPLPLGNQIKGRAFLATLLQETSSSRSLWVSWEAVKLGEC